MKLIIRRIFFLSKCDCKIVTHVEPISVLNYAKLLDINVCVVCIAIEVHSWYILLLKTLLDRFNSCVLLVNSREHVCPSRQGCLEVCDDYIYICPYFFIQLLFM